MKARVLFFVLATFVPVFFSCQSKTRHEAVQNPADTEGTFGHDLQFLEKHTSVKVLIAPDDQDAKIIIAAAYQGRVMTSTANGEAGNSYGWINYDLIKKGIYQPHMNGYGGEERFWLGPEGGQFSIFFEKGKSFDFEHWQTPALIDTVGYDEISSDSASVTFQKDSEIKNYYGTSFTIRIKRKISVMAKPAIQRSLGITALDGCRAVAYESVNEIINRGEDWKSESGTLGIWLLGMFRPTDKTVIIAPFTKQFSAKLLLTDDYFGAIPTDRIEVKDSVVLLRADGKYRSKIGLSPRSAKNVAGSYDSEKKILTIIQFGVKRSERYLKSAWEIHKDPYDGDVLNAYNDGKLADGTQMGPFYELESNSHTRPLRQGESIVHRQSTYHFEGSKTALEDIAFKVLGVSLDEIESAF